MFDIDFDLLHLFRDIVVAELLHDLLGAVYDHIRHTRQLRHLNAVALVRTALDDLAQKDDVVPFLLDGNAIVVHIVHLAFQLRQLMVVGGKKCLGAEDLAVADMFDHRPGDAQPVEGRRSSSDLVQHEQAVRGGVAQYVCHLIHLHHEGRLPA